MTSAGPKCWYRNRSFIAVIILFSVATVLIYARYEFKSNEELSQVGEIVVGTNKTLVLVNGLNQTLLSNVSNVLNSNAGSSVEVKEIKNLLVDINRTLANPNRTLNVKNAS